MTPLKKRMTQKMIWMSRYKTDMTLCLSLSLDPDDIRVRASRADALVGLGQHLKALDDLDICLTAAPSPEVGCWHNVSESLLNTARAFSSVNDQD